MIVVFILGCFAILGVVALIRNWRAADEREEWAKEQLPFGIADDLGGEEAEGHETATQPAPAPAATNEGDWGDDWLEPDYPSLVAARPAGEQAPRTATTPTSGALKFPPTTTQSRVVVSGTSRRSTGSGLSPPARCCCSTRGSAASATAISASTSSSCSAVF